MFKNVLRTLMKNTFAKVLATQNNCDVFVGKDGMGGKADASDG